MNSSLFSIQEPVVHLNNIQYSHDLYELFEVWWIYQVLSKFMERVTRIVHSSHGASYALRHS